MPFIGTPNGWPFVAGIKQCEAALTLWRYCDASARYIFGDLVGDPVADTILRALRNQNSYPIPPPPGFP
jgi:hypothetical protein